MEEKRNGKKEYNKEIYSDPFTGLRFGWGNDGFWAELDKDDKKQIIKLERKDEKNV